MQPDEESPFCRRHRPWPRSKPTRTPFATESAALIFRATTKPKQQDRRDESSRMVVEGAPGGPAMPPLASACVSAELRRCSRLSPWMPRAPDGMPWSSHARDQTRIRRRLQPLNEGDARVRSNAAGRRDRCSCHDHRCRRTGHRRGSTVQSTDAVGRVRIRAVIEFARPVSEARACPIRVRSGSQSGSIGV